MNDTNISLANFNLSASDADYRRSLKKVSDHLTVITLMLIMLAMGTDILFKQVWSHLRRPWSACIGMLCQFVIMPLLGFLLVVVANLQGPYALSVLLIACSPGGAVSNVFAYFLDGDLALSVTMTSLSTLLALGFMPFNIWMYGKWIETGHLVIPYTNIAKSLGFVTSPVCVGMLIKWKFPTVAYYITKIGSLCGFFLIAVAVTLHNLAYPDILSDVPWKLCLIVFVMPTTGLCIGFCISWLCRRDMAVRKTVAVECGVQNVAIAFAVISLSPFSFKTQKYLLLFPMMYGISMISLCFVVCLAYHLHKKLCMSKTKEISGKSESPLEEKPRRGTKTSNVVYPSVIHYTGHSEEKGPRTTEP